jgi:hypothetical protein
MKTLCAQTVAHTFGCLGSISHAALRLVPAQGMAAVPHQRLQSRRHRLPLCEAQPAVLLGAPRACSVRTVAVDEPPRHPPILTCHTQLAAHVVAGGGVPAARILDEHRSSGRADLHVSGYGRGHGDAIHRASRVAGIAVGAGHDERAARVLIDVCHVPRQRATPCHSHASCDVVVHSAHSERHSRSPVRYKEGESSPDHTEAHRHIGERLADRSIRALVQVWSHTACRIIPCQSVGIGVIRYIMPFQSFGQAQYRHVYI